MNKNELMNIKGGSTFSATVLNSIARVANSVLEIGRAIGSSIRRAILKKKCSIS